MLEWHCTYGVTDVQDYADGSTTARVNCDSREMWVAYFPAGERNTQYLLRGGEDEGVSHFKSRREAEECLATCELGPLWVPTPVPHYRSSCQLEAVVQSHPCS